jgi:hypothetical protein
MSTKIFGDDNGNINKVIIILIGRFISSPFINLADAYCGGCKKNSPPGELPPCRGTALLLSLTGFLTIEIEFVLEGWSDAANP